MLVAHLDGGLGERPANELGLALSEARRRGRWRWVGQGMGELDTRCGRCSLQDGHLMSVLVERGRVVCLKAQCVQFKWLYWHDSGSRK